MRAEAIRRQREVADRVRHESVETERHHEELRPERGDLLQCGVQCGRVRAVPRAGGQRDVQVRPQPPPRAGLVSMADGETVKWKFPEGWVELTKTELGGIVAAGAAHIQTQFDWEKNIGDQIDAAPDVDTLKTILNEINGVTV